jgi:hypothetical protein
MEFALCASQSHGSSHHQLMPRREKKRIDLSKANFHETSKLVPLISSDRVTETTTCWDSQTRNHYIICSFNIVFLFNLMSKWTYSLRWYRIGNRLKARLMMIYTTATLSNPQLPSSAVRATFFFLSWCLWPWHGTSGSKFVYHLLMAIHRSQIPRGLSILCG